MTMIIKLFQVPSLERIFYFIQGTSFLGSELVISRTAHKNDASKYAINGRSSNFTDVTSLLMSKGIDLEHNRFLILQGEVRVTISLNPLLSFFLLQVEQIAMMKPKGTNPNETGVLEYLEDIIGSSKCIEPINVAQSEVRTNPIPSRCCTDPCHLGRATSTRRSKQFNSR